MRQGRGTADPVHDLRHMCASLLLAQAALPGVLMEVLGHSQIGVIMNTYAHVLPVVQQQPADQLDLAAQHASGPRKG